MIERFLLGLEPIHISIMVGLAIFLTVLLTARFGIIRGQVNRRAVAPLGSSGGTLGGTMQRRAKSMMERAAAVFARRDRANDSQLRRQLVQAGIFSEHAAPLFSAIRLLTAVGLPIGVLLLGTLLPFEVPAMLSALLAICCALLGLVLPPILLDFRIRSMQRRYRHAFPDVMDLLLVCVESGQSLQSAIGRVSEEMMQVCPELGFNLHLLSLELRAGSTLHEGLQSLQDRLCLEEVQSLALLLKQSEELGASIGGTLRVFSDEMRDKRLIRAETKANSLPVKITVPLGLFIFPVILLVILVPVVIRIKNAFV